MINFGKKDDDWKEAVLLTFFIYIECYPISYYTVTSN